MNEGLIPRRYAKALYKVGADRGDNDALYARMKALDAAFADTPGMKDVVSNPFVPTDDKIALLCSAVSVVSSAKGGDDATFVDFMRLLAENRRIGMVREIAAAYREVSRKAKNLKLEKVTSAAPLSAESDARLRKLIASHLGGATMEYSGTTDPALIGGFTVTVDSERLDASIRNDLKELRLKLIQ